MNLASKATANLSHGFILLRELNSQRGMGQFCDCVLKLHIHPGRIFLAHKSVLAAFSPVLASLLPHHGALVDLNLPYLTPETLDNLLDYIYTGTLPPRSQEESVLSAAFHLQMDQLQQALRCRRKAMAKITNTVQDKLSQKRRFVKTQSLDGTPLASPSYYPYGSDPPASSAPSCEVVPVICHVRTAGNNKFPLQTRCRDSSASFSIEGAEANEQAKDVPHHGYPQTTQGLDTSLLDQFFEPAQHKQDKFLATLSENAPNDPPSVPQKTENHFSSSSDSEFKSTPSLNRELHFEADSKDQCVNSSHTLIKDMSSETEHSPQNHRCDGIGDIRRVSDMGAIHSFNLFDSGKGEHLVEILTDTFNDKSSYSSINNLKDRSHLCGQFSAENCPESQAPLCLETSSSNEMHCEKSTSDPDAWMEIAQPYEQKLFEGKAGKIFAAEKTVIEDELQRADHIKNSEFSKPRKDYAYQGQLHCQCLLEYHHSTADSSDSDSDRACSVPNTTAKDSSTVLETIDITEISLSTSQPPKSPCERSTTHPFQCSMCDRAFSQRGSLNRHMRSHLGVRPYSCPQCSMTFSRQYRVTEHMRVHQRSCEGQLENRLRTAAGVDV